MAITKVATAVSHFGTKCDAYLDTANGRITISMDGATSYELVASGSGAKGISVLVLPNGRFHLRFVNASEVLAARESTSAYPAALADWATVTP